MAIEPAGPRPLRADAERNRTRLLEAARELFAERGLGVSMDDIAARAGVGVGTAYRRFSCRHELIDALFDERIEEFVAASEAALAEPDAYEALIGFLETALAKQAADRGLKELLMSSEGGRERMRAARARVIPVVEELIRRAQDSGDLRGDVGQQDLAVINVMLLSAADFTGDADPQAWRRYLGIVFDGLRAKRAEPTPLERPPIGPEQLEEAIAGWRPPHRCAR